MLFKFALLSVLLGRGIYLLLWDAPYRSVLWDEALLSGLVNQFGSWEAWVSSPALDQGIILFTQLQGGLLLLTALALFLPYKKLTSSTLFLTTINLIILAFAGFWNSHHQVGYFFEYALQISLPLAYYFHLKPSFQKLVVPVVAMGCALTFLGHGLYAIGYYIRPGRFVDMVLAILPVEQTFAHQMLFMAGVFDLLFFALILTALFMPGKISAKLVMRFLLVASFWGFTTAAARWFAYVEWQMLADTLMMWGPQVLYRLVHGAAPLWLYFQWRQYRESQLYQQTPLKASILSV